MTAAWTFLLTLPASILAVGLVLRWLRARQILDHPNDRSSHALATPRGGGLGVVPVVLAAWAILAFQEWPLPGQPMVMAGAAGLLLLSWRDDRGGLSARLRLSLQAVAVAAGIMALPADHLIFQGLLPWWGDRLLTGVGWLWFVNLYNFMDGIDGITGVETACLGLGLALLGIAPPQSLALTAAALGFLCWNWPPAKLFLGDAGSIPLGYLTGWLLILLAGDGHLAAALILPAYYLADSGLTLIARACRREPVWQAHRQHFYQRATQGGASHRTVTLTILAADLALIGLAFGAELYPYPAVAAAVLLTAALLLSLDRLGRRRQLK